MLDLDSLAEGSEGSRLLQIVRSGRRRSGGSSVEATGLESADPLPDKERLGLLEEALRKGAERPQAEGRPEPALAEQVLAGARSGLAKAQAGDTPLSNREMVGLEAVILTDGTRPSLTIHDGFVDLASPEIGDWDLALQQFQDAIRRVLRCVGRVDVPVQPGFAGTCFLVAPDVVATNRHVLEAIASQDANGVWTFRWPGQTTVNFVGEDGAALGTRIPVTDVLFAGADAIDRTIDFRHLDFGLLRIDPGAVADFPSPVRLEKDLDALGETRELYVVGFPARPRTHFGPTAPGAGSETAEVMRSVFAWKFGVKKLAPGAAVAVPGALPNDAKKWVFTHNASTLGGNSGSAVVDLGLDGARVIGIHFGGESRAQNWAHSFAAVRAAVPDHGQSYL